jgi:putative PIN family toxin of toxin-antitoxin system
VIRAVIDTNVMVSGLLTPRGNEALIILAVHQGIIHPCFSKDILAEYSEVLARPKFAFEPEEIGALLTTLHGRGELICPVGLSPTLPDRDDSKFLHCAQAASAEFIITGNKRHFPQDICGAISVVSAGELLNRITLEI